jgi:hypothetical protein
VSSGFSWRGSNRAQGVSSGDRRRHCGHGTGSCGLGSRSDPVRPRLEQQLDDLDDDGGTLRGGRMDRRRAEQLELRHRPVERDDGGPDQHQGQPDSCFWNTSCIEMRPSSAFLDALNATDETPGAVDYGTWWSPCDEIINPDSSVAVSGAVNTQTACMTHGDLHENATVYGQVRNFVN